MLTSLLIPIYKIAGKRNTLLAARKFLDFASKKETINFTKKAGIGLGLGTAAFSLWDVSGQATGNLSNLAWEATGINQEQVHAGGVNGERVESGTQYGTMGKFINDAGQVVFSIASIATAGKLSKAAEAGKIGIKAGKAGIEAAAKAAKTLKILKGVTLGLFGLNAASLGHEIGFSDQEGLAEGLVDKGNTAVTGLTLASTFSVLRTAAKAVARV